MLPLLSTMTKEYESGKTTYDIARKYGCSQCYVFKSFKRAGVKLRPKAYQVDYDWVVDEYLSGRTTKSIAKEIGCHYATVLNILKREGVASRLRPAIDDGELVMLYREGRSTVEVGELLKISSSTVENRLRRLGEKVRSQYEAVGLLKSRIRLSCKQRGLPVDGFDGFFNARSRTLRQSETYLGWRKQVFKRDKTCRVCNDRFQRQAHHIIPVRVAPELITKPENGITLCKECHAAVRRQELHYAADYNMIFIEEYGRAKVNTCPYCNIESQSLTLVPNFHFCSICERLSECAL